MLKKAAWVMLLAPVGIGIVAGIISLTALAVMSERWILLTVVAGLWITIIGAATVLTLEHLEHRK